MFGIRLQGLRDYLRHYLSPSPILLPFHLISEVTRTVALAVRLFGNIMSLEMAALLVLLVAGFLVPIPILMLHIVEALVQAEIGAHDDAADDGAGRETLLFQDLRQRYEGPVEPVIDVATDPVMERDCPGHHGAVGREGHRHR